MIARPWGIVLDADVFLRSSARDLFLYLGTLGVVDPLWSEPIIREVARNFPGGPERFSGLEAAMEEIFPAARKSGFEHHIGTLALTSEKDRHVLALAAEYEADLISFNHKDYDPAEAMHFGVRVWPPDDALELLIHENPDEVGSVVRRAFVMLRKPPVCWADYIAHIRADGMPKVAEWVAGLPEFQRRL